MHCITIGSATIDIIVQLPKDDVERLTMHNTHISFMMLEMGRKLGIDAIETCVGGCAVNAAVAMNNLNHTVCPMIKVKDDLNGHKVIEHLKQKGVDTKNVIHTAKKSTATSILISSEERDPAVFTYRGANTELTLADISPEQLATADLIYITPLSGQSSSVLPALTTMAKQSGAFVAHNPGIIQLKNRADEILDSLKNMDCMTINTHEAAQLVPAMRQRGVHSGRIECPDDYKHRDKMRIVRSGLSKDNDHINMATFMRTMIAWGLHYMVVTDGKNGAYMGTVDGVYFAPSHPVTVAGTIGAGDAFASTLTTYLATPENTDMQALMAGTLNSASVVSHADTQTGLLDAQTLTKAITAYPTENIAFMTYQETA